MAKARTKGRNGGRPARRGVPPQRRTLPDVRFQRGTRAATIGLQSWDEDTLSFEGVLASETPCRSFRFSPDGWDLVDVDEVLSMEGIRSVDQLVGAPLLNMHSSYSLQSVVGVIEAARVEGTQLIIRARLWDREDLADVIDGVRDGILRNMSVGFDRFEETYQERDGKCPLVTVTGWQPAEGSLVAIPADPTAQIRAAGAKPKPSGSRRKPASTERTAAMASRSNTGKRSPSVDELKENLKRARAAFEAARAKQGSRGRRDADEDEGDEDAEDGEGERSRRDADGDDDEDEDDADQKKRAARAKARRAKRDEDMDDGRDGDTDDEDEDEEDDKRARKAAVVRGLRAVAQRRGKDALADFDAVRDAGGSVADLRALAMDAVRTRTGERSSTSGERRSEGNADRPQLRSFSETALAKRNKR